MTRTIAVLIGILSAAAIAAFFLIPSRQPKAIATEPKPPQPCPSEEILQEEILPKGAPVQRTWTKVSSDVFQQEYCNGELAIKLADGGTKVITDDRVPGEHSRMFRLKDFYADLSLLLLSAKYSEGEAYRVVSVKDGSEYDLFCEKPLFSPSRLYLVSHCLSLTSEGPADGIGVWAIADDKLTNVFKYNDAGGGMKDVSWKDDETILFTEVDIIPGDDERYKEKAGQALVKQETGWTVIQPETEPPPAKPRVIARLGSCGSDPDLVGDRLYHLNGLTEALKKHNIPVIPQTDGFGCDTQFIKDGEILVIDRIFTDADLYEMARKYFQLPDQTEKGPNE